MKKKILLCLIAQLICWGIMTMSDYMEETYNDSFNLIVVFAVPMMCVVLYIIFRRLIYDNQMVRLKDVVIICETWLICGLILGFLIGALVNNQMWIVSQATGGWEHLLNGIEYMMFAVTLAGIPFVAVVLIESVIGIVKLLRKTRRNKIMIKILFICHGNICRSTMAESVMTYLVEKEGLADKFYINSAATSREEIGNGVHHGTVAKLKKEGIPVIPHRAVQMTLNDYEEYDYLIGMDTENIRNMQRISGGDPDEKIYKLLTFAGSGLDVADPWYTGDFEATYRDVLAGCKGLLECLKEEL